MKKWSDEYRWAIDLLKEIYGEDNVWYKEFAFGTEFGIAVRRADGTRRAVIVEHGDFSLNTLDDAKDVLLTTLAEGKGVPPGGILEGTDQEVRP